MNIRELGCLVLVLFTVAPTSAAVYQVRPSPNTGAGEKSLEWFNQNSAAGDIAIMSGDFSSIGGSSVTDANSIYPYRRAGNSSARIVYAGAAGNVSTATVRAIKLWRADTGAPSPDYFTIKWVTAVSTIDVYSSVNSGASYDSIYRCVALNGGTLEGLNHCTVVGNAFGSGATTEQFAFAARDSE